MSESLDQTNDQAMCEDMAFVYILECADNTYYTGWTTDVDRRVTVHNAGKGARYTRCRRPVKLVHVESFGCRQEAMRREWHIKQLSRKQKEELIRHPAADEAAGE
ncbi:GIY-YIG nuclease family protein [Faecalibaculum rodentium]|uniref:GIY-YIG nuclease family protein n=1 Tax=Faecalibaculum rodentium TaxID=1702221 RepID=UPI0025709060|nr:GIY-YIG nuclease family protein [Faecalibaculum rodentium]